MKSFGPYPATVTKVHDGDTIAVDVVLTTAGRSAKETDLGFNVWRSKRGTELRSQSVRLFGCNAPELKTAAGVAARAYLLTLVAVGDRVQLLSHGWDKFGGRIDGAVTLHDGRDLVQLMIAAGHALPWDGTGAKPV